MSKTGKKLGLTTYGEGDIYGCILEGLPEGVKVSENDVSAQLKRMAPNKAKGFDFKFVSGMSNGESIGAPILCQVDTSATHVEPNISADYPRPSQPDFAYNLKYGSGLPASRLGEGELMGRIGAGVVAEKWLSQKFGVDIIGFVSQVGSVSVDIDQLEYETISRDDVVNTGELNAHSVSASYKLQPVIANVREEKDTVGGVITCICRNVPTGWGEPIFESLEGKLAQAMFSIPNVKGVAVGAGFEAAKKTGSVNNDMFTQRGSRLGTVTNNCGGVLGGVSDGETIYFTIAFAPNPQLNTTQTSVKYDGEPTVVAASGVERYSPCTVPMCVPVVEAMAALVLADLALLFSDPSCSSIPTSVSTMTLNAARLRASKGNQDIMSFEDLQAKYEREAKLREAFQAQLTKKVKAEANALPKHYLYPGLVVGGAVLGLYFGRRWFGNSSYSVGFGSYSSGGNGLLSF
eukprot:m.44065 g.44065  ORF g.44065 m.44065 type:complete len:461 (+) comp7145_c0_seq3:149-1531(+)